VEKKGENEKVGKKTEIRRSSPRRGREGSRWHRLASAVQAPASHTTPTQQQNQKKKEKQPSQHNVHNKQGGMNKSVSPNERKGR